MDRDAMILDALSKLSDKVDDTKQSIHDVDKTLAEQRVEFKDHKKNFEQHMADHVRDHKEGVKEHRRMNDLLDVHIKATRRLEQRDLEKDLSIQANAKDIVGLDKRVIETETPLKFSKTLIKIILGLGTLAAAGAAILKFMDMI